MKRFLITLSLIFAGLLCGQSADYDVVIRNGHVLDGNVNPWIRGDVGIRDGHIVKIGKIDTNGRREIDAAGKYVSPGWIDMLDQSGRALMQNGFGGKQSRDGCHDRYRR